MVVVGVDAHKKTHTLVAVDDVGRRLGGRTIKATDEGHADALRWVRRNFGSDVVWGLEDCRQVTTRLESMLLHAAQRVIRVPPRLTAGVRRSARTPGKSDPIDALQIARAVQREPDLPAAFLDEGSREVNLLWLAATCLSSSAAQQSFGCCGGCMSLTRRETSREPP
jgi:transposase